MRRRADWIHAIAAIIVIVLQTLIADKVNDNNEVLVQQQNVIEDVVSEGGVNECPK